MKKKKKNVFFIVFVILLGAYSSVYILYKSGYYEYKEKTKMLLTEEAMTRFESDIKEGKDITLSDYIDNTKNDYTNTVSKLGLNAGKKIESFVNDGLGKIFKVIGSLFSE